MTPHDNNGEPNTGSYSLQVEFLLVTLETKTKNVFHCSSIQSIRRLFDHVGGEGVVAGDADGVAGQGVGVPPRRPAAGQTDITQRGEEDLTVVGRHQVVEDGVDGRADVEQDVGQHVEVVVEVVHAAVGETQVSLSH